MSAKVVLSDEITNKIKDLTASGMSTRKVQYELNQLGFNISRRQIMKVINTNLIIHFEVTMKLLPGKLPSEQQLFTWLQSSARFGVVKSICNHLIGFHNLDKIFGKVDATKLEGITMDIKADLKMHQGKTLSKENLTMWLQSLFQFGVVDYIDNYQVDCSELQGIDLKKLNQTTEPN